MSAFGGKLDIGLLVRISANDPERTRLGQASPSIRIHNELSSTGLGLAMKTILFEVFAALARRCVGSKLF